MSARPLGVAIVVSLSLVACGDDDDERRLLDVGPIETGIARGIERDRPGTQVVSVTCPEDVELEKGSTFTCRVKGSKPGEDAFATVTQEDDEGRVRYRVP